MARAGRRRSARNGSAPGRRGRLGDEEQAYVDGILHPATREETEAGAPLPLSGHRHPNASEPLRFRQTDQYVRDLQNWSAAEDRPRPGHRGLQPLAGVQQEAASQGPPDRRWQRQYPFVVGKLEKGKTPSDKLDLRPGDLVRIKSKEEIEATLDKTNHNRGLSFDGEMSNYCGRTARVRARVNRLIEESTGEMIDIKSDCIILEGVVCAADYHRFCTAGDLSVLARGLAREGRRRAAPERLRRAAARAADPGLLAA